MCCDSRPQSVYLLAGLGGGGGFRGRGVVRARLSSRLCRTNGQRIFTADQTRGRVQRLPGAPSPVPVPAGGYHESLALYVAPLLHRAGLRMLRCAPLVGVFVVFALLPLRLCRDEGRRQPSARSMGDQKGSCGTVPARLACVVHLVEARRTAASTTHHLQTIGSNE